MAFKTKAQMLDSILQELALVTGSSVQTYNEPIIFEYIQRGFDHLFSKRYWDHLTAVTFHTLDGTAGVVTDSISGIETLADIQWIRAEPYGVLDEIFYYSDGIFDDQRTGYSGLPFSHAQYADKRLQFYPKTSTSSVAIRARRKPANFEKDEIIPFDNLALIHFVTASILAIDGMNPSAQARQDALFNDRYETLVMNEGDNKITSQNSYNAHTFTVANP